MRKLYGDTLRTDAGFVKVIKKVAQKNARLLETRAGKHAPEIKRVAKEVKGTFDKVYEETAEAVEEFLARCKSIPHPITCRSYWCVPLARPKITEVVQDTKVLLQQSRERLVISYVPLFSIFPGPIIEGHSQASFERFVALRHIEVRHFRSTHEP